MSETDDTQISMAGSADETEPTNGPMLTQQKQS